MSMTTPFNPSYTLSNGLKTVVVDPVLGNVNEPGYIMTLRLSDANGLFAVLKQSLNEANKVIFDVSEILRITEPTYDLHDGNTLTSTNSVKSVTIEAREVWDSGQNTIATESGFVIHGAMQFTDGLLYNEGANRDVFLSEFKTVQATNDDFGVVAVAPQLEDEVTFSVYDSNNSVIQTFATSLAIPVSTQTRVQHAALFPKSLDVGQSVNLASNWAKYEAQVGTQIITVTRECEQPYRKYRLAFWNTRGGWDYFNFDLNHTETIEIEREEFAKVYGSWSASTFGYAQHERGRAVYDSKTVERVTVNAKVTQAESEALKKLLGSREVQLLDGIVGRPIMVTDTSFPVFHDMDRSRKTLTVTFEMAHEILNA